MDAFIGEIRAFGFARIPENWLRCEGQLLPKSQYEALYSIIEYTYGGDPAKRLFRLPDLRCAVLVGTGVTQGDTYELGRHGGMAAVILTTDQMPRHTHAVNQAIAHKDQIQSTRSDLSTSLIANLPEAGANGIMPVASTALAQATVSIAGNHGAHENRQPYLAVNYCICVAEGDYPIKASN